ncbi:MAG: hypothetical protein EZS28_048641, partial [Streblomastix strix]
MLCLDVYMNSNDATDDEPQSIVKVRITLIEMFCKNFVTSQNALFLLRGHCQNLTTQLV